MSLAAQFYSRDIEINENSRGGTSSRRPLYTHNNNNINRAGEPPRYSQQPTLTSTYRGPGTAHLPHPSQFDDAADHDDALMTEAERANFAHELSLLEHEAARGQSREQHVQHRENHRLHHDDGDDGGGGGAVEITHSPPTFGAYERKGRQHYSSSLGEHFDPQLLSDTSIPSNFFPHARARRTVEEANEKPHMQKDEFFRKNERWRDHVELKNEILRKEFSTQAAAECTFTPAINRASSPTASSRVRHVAGGSGAQRFGAGSGYEDDGGDSPHRQRGGSTTPRGPHHEDHQRFTEMDVTTRLLQFEKQRKNRLEIRTRESKLEEERQFVFRPKTNKQKWTASITPRYLDPKEPKVAPSSSHAAGLPQQQLDGRSRSASASNEHYGRPETNDGISWTKSSNKLDSYLNKPVHLRLHQSAVVSQERRRRDEELRFRNEARRPGRGSDRHSVLLTTEAPSYEIGESTLSAIGDSTAMLESSLTITTAEGRRRRHAAETTIDPSVARLDERLKVDAAERQRHLDEIQRETLASCTFQPVTAVYRPPKHAIKGMTPKEAYPQSFSFAPKVDGASSAYVAKRYGTRTVDDLLKYGEDTSQRLLRQKEDREKAAEAAAGGEASLGTPRISRYAQQVEGKIANSIRTTEDYQRFLAMQRRMRQRDIELVNRQRNEAEEAELTFRPEIHAAPSYISEIVKELRESRMSTSRSRSRSQL
jgi:hypothetical protein